MSHAQPAHETQAAAPAQQSTKPGLNALAASWMVLAAITLAQATEAFTVQGFPSLVPLLTQELVLTKTQIGMLTSAFFLGGFITVLPAGWLIDRLGVRLSLVAGLSSMSVCVVIASRTSTFALLYVCLVLSGIGFGSVYPATTKAVMHWAPAKLRGTMMGIKQTGVPLGGAIASVTLPALALRSGWRGALFVAAMACAVCTVLCHIMYRTHPDETTPRRKGAEPNGARGAAALKAALTNREIWFVNISGLFFLCVQGTLVGWLVSYLTADGSLQVVAAGAALAAVQIGGAIGRLGWGTVSDLVFGGRRVPIVAAMGVLTAIVLWTLPYAATAGYGTLIALCLVAGLSGLGWVGMVTVLRAELAPPQAVGIVTSLGSFTGYAGSLLGPPLFGKLLDTTGDYQLAWRALAACALIAAVLITRVREKRG